MHPHNVVLAISCFFRFNALVVADEEETALSRREFLNVSELRMRFIEDLFVYPLCAVLATFRAKVEYVHAICPLLYFCGVLIILVSTLVGVATLTASPTLYVPIAVFVVVLF